MAKSCPGCGAPITWRMCKYCGRDNSTSASPKYDPDKMKNDAGRMTDAEFEQLKKAMDNLLKGQIMR